MVGVPRSKGCGTCRKRKIGCSKERPTCLQCREAGRQCLGYEKDTIFLHNNGSYSIQKHGVLDIHKAATTTTTEPGFIASYKANDAGKVLSSPSSRIKSSIIPYSTRSSLACVNTQSDWALIQAAVKRNIIHTWAESDLQQKHPLVSGKVPWSHYALERPEMDQALETSMLAFASAMLGRKACDTRLRQQSSLLYGQGLKQMQYALRDSKRMYSDEVLGACALLTLYEVVECPLNSRNGYLNHHEGCARLIELRGPAAHREGLAHKIFLQFRYQACLEALKTKKTYLMKPEWKSIPWSIEPKETMDQFLDVMLDGLELLFRGDEIFGDPECSHLHLQYGTELLKSCWDWDVNMAQFLQNLENDRQNPLYWPVLSPIGDKYDDDFHSESLFTTQIEFIDFKVAMPLILYWASLTVLWSAMSFMYDMIDEMADKRDTYLLSNVLNVSDTSDMSNEQIYQLLGIPDRGHSSDYMEPASKVLQSVPFCFRDSICTRMAAAPLVMVMNTLKSRDNYKAEVRWIQNTLRKIERSGMKLLPYINDSTNGRRFYSEVE